MGTGGFAVPSFQRLIEADHEILALVTMPIRGPSGKAPTVTPMREIALERNIPIYDPENINSSECRDLLYLLAAEVFFVCDYGRILSEEILKTSRMGGLNLHGSLLPRYRGAAPINRAILDGAAYTGVSVIHMIPEVDAGPVVAKSPMIPIGPDDTAIELEERLALIGSWLIVQTITQMETGRLSAIPQLHEQISKAPKLKKEEGLLDWSRGGQFVCNHIRAMVPWPKSYTYWHREKGTPLRLILHAADLLPASETEASPNGVAPGTVLKARGEDLWVAAADEIVRVSSVQPSGKGVMSAGALINGYRIQPGDFLGPENR